MRTVSRLRCWVTTQNGGDTPTQWPTGYTRYARTPRQQPRNLLCGITMQCLIHHTVARAPDRSVYSAKSVTAPRYFVNGGIGDARSVSGNRLTRTRREWYPSTYGHLNLVWSNGNELSNFSAMKVRGSWCEPTPTVSHSQRHI